IGLLKTRRVPVPVLVVGNLVAGGSGKTPLTIAMVERLCAAGWTPGVASRGYGRKEPGTPRWVEATTDPDLGGDEPVLIALRTGAKLRVDGDRVAAARALAAAGCDIVVCDDGLQHYRLARDLEIEVVDGRRRYGNGLLLPAGPLREPPERGERCDFRVMNAGNSTDLVAGFGEWPMWFEPGAARPLRGGRPKPLSAFAGQRVHAIAGIGDPERFFAMLRDHGIAVVPHAFADHHRYDAEDLRFGSDLPVLMTEKDAVKCATLANDRYFSVSIDARLPEAFWIALLDRLARLRPVL
ncbi:MAG TPA: tetraacyldisaccharide 4'-kinase, partial [Luteimonas sp.]|nr:tetraacyldisaccharide 4'-kinase [Luteimonas sp.]